MPRKKPLDFTLHALTAELRRTPPDRKPHVARFFRDLVEERRIWVIDVAPRAVWIIGAPGIVRWTRSV